MAAQFVAGVQHHLPAICAVTAPSVISYIRLTPNRWAPTRANLAQQDREAAIRICPIFARAGVDPADQFNFEFRVCDAAASPYLALGARDLGRRRRHPPASVPLPADGGGALPHSLGEALDRLAATPPPGSGSARCCSTPICATSAARCASSAISIRSSSAARYAEVY